MIITKEISLDQFEPWSGAVSTFDRIYDEGKMDELESILEEEYPDGIDEGHLNYLFWFEEVWLFDILGIVDEDDDWDDEDEDDLDEGCNRRTKGKKLKEEITDEVYDCAERVANEIEEKGILNFSEIEDIVADCLGLPVEDVDSDTFTDVYVILGYLGINQNFSTGDFYTQDYAENHPEVLEESKSSKRRSKKLKENFSEASTEIRDWYKKTYPDDELGDYLRDGLTFQDLFEAMDNYLDVYIVLGVSDSLVRERVFGELEEIMGVDYDYIYDQWLKSKDDTTEEDVLAFLGK